jgi:gluconolactonase
VNHQANASELRMLATGLGFPEGPIAMSDGSVLLVEIEAKTLSRIMPDGERRVVARLQGGPNGAAIGPDGRCYICNNGGLRFIRKDGLLMPVGAPSDYDGGWIEAVDLATGESEVLYRACGDIPLRAPNDLVFDQHGGFWFSDNGKIIGVGK